ncbi:MAG: redoxin domain-containing protein, partial [Clostridia bacterium]|nr:redoxin domain-containing protein [Clostridia bacterium]
RNATITLSVNSVEYETTVIDKSGNPASGVTVNWTNGSSLAGTATTDENGKASKVLNYGEYSVTLSNLPANNVYDGAKTVYGNNPSLEFRLIDGVAVDYSVTVRSEGKLLFKKQDVAVHRGTALIASGQTDDNGVFTFDAPALTYTVTATNLQAGYSCEPLQLNGSKREGELILKSAVITEAPAVNKTYVMGDIIHDYTFTTPYALNGSVWSKSVSDILHNKEALIINNWGTQCSNCIIEMPEMQEVYEKYKERIELVAVSNYVPRDTDAVITNFYAANQYSFPMMRDVNGFASKFSITGWPTTVIIDRYGAIARIEVGAVTSAEAWERMILKYIGDEYEQTFPPGAHVSESINTEIAKPDIEVPADHYDTIATTISSGYEITWWGEEDESRYAWPFLIDTVDGVSSDKKVLYASNSGKANSWAVLYANVTLKPGKVLTFDYYSETQSGGDFLYVIWGDKYTGRVIKEISGNSKGWQTCYLYSEFIEGTYDFAFVYQKDGTVNTGRDNVYLRDVRVIDYTGIDQPTDMLRPAAYGGPDESGKKLKYYVDVNLSDDGYYHVDATTISFAGTDHTVIAGNDDSPLLLVNAMESTSWSNYSLSQLVVGKDEDTNEYVYDCTFTINGVTRDYRDDLVAYLKAALASDVPGYAPVNQFLREMLVQFMAKVSGEYSHADEWLEICYFYSHYGSGDPVGNPIIGLMPATATPITEGVRYTANLTRDQAPFPTWIYTFTPDESAVYKIESLIPDSDKGRSAAQIWLYDDNGDPDHGIAHSGQEHVTLGGVNEHNFELLHYLEQGHKYYIEVAFQMQGAGQLDFKVTKVGQSAVEWAPCSSDDYSMLLD